MRSFRHYGLPLLYGLLFGMLIIHFGMTLVYLTPLNPIRLRIVPVVEPYMTPWFAQDWRLFAPDPINETRISQP